MGLLMGEIVRFWGESSLILGNGLVWKVMLVIVVIQTAFYYFDLYELRHFGNRAKMTIHLLEAMAVSSLI
jgi:hypothetical protein